MELIDRFAREQLPTEVLSFSGDGKGI